MDYQQIECNKVCYSVNTCTQTQTLNFNSITLQQYNTLFDLGLVATGCPAEETRRKMKVNSWCWH